MAVTETPVMTTGQVATLTLSSSRVRQLVVGQLVDLQSVCMRVRVCVCVCLSV